MVQESDDFVILSNSTSPDGERKNRADAFVEAFVSGFSESPIQQANILKIIDQGQRQPDSVSCFFASLVAAARGMGTSSEPFQSELKALVSQAKQLGIVDEWGVAQTYTEELTEICHQVGIEPEFVTFFPNDMTADQSKELGKKTATALSSGFGIAMLIPQRHHYVLIHNNSPNIIFVYDPISRADNSVSVSDVASSMANISNGEMLGERYSGNGFVILKPVSNEDPDFVLNSIK